MYAELVSACSAKVIWTPHPGEAGQVRKAYRVQVRRANSSDTFKVSKVTEDAFAVVANFDPNTNYEVLVECILGDSWASLESMTFTTESESEPHLDRLYESLRRPDGSYDATLLDEAAHDNFLKHFSSFVTTGDVLETPIKLHGARFNVTASAVAESDSFDVGSSKNVMLPFSPDSGAGKVVLMRGEDARTVRYSDATNTITVEGKTYGIGDRFQMFGRTVTVADGSIVLVFSDSVVAAYPHSASTASAVTSTYGSNFVKDFTASEGFMMATKSANLSASSKISGMIFDTPSGTVKEISRIVQSVDSGTTSGTISLGVLRTNGGDSFIEPTIETSYNQTLITSQDATGSSVTVATIANDGISFDSDSAAMYFGASKNFKMVFVDGAVPSLKLQAYDSTSSSYVTKLEITQD